MSTSFESEYLNEFNQPSENLFNYIPLLVHTADEVEVFSTSRRGEPLGWGPTPLNPYLPEIAEQQKQVAMRTDRLFDNPPFAISNNVKEYVLNSHYGRVQHRIHKNFESFSHRVQFNLNDTPEQLQPMQQRVLTGNGSPAEAIYINTYLGVPTYEIASLVLPYGQNTELLPQMRTTVKESIDFCDGKTFESPIEDFQIKGANFLDSHSDDNNHAKLLLITRTNTLGNLPNDAVIFERSSFVYCLDDQQYTDISRFEFGPLWSKKILNRTQLLSAVKQSLADDDFMRAIPISSTTFVVDEPLATDLLNASSSAYTIRQREIVTAAAQEATTPKNDFPKGWMKKSNW